MKIDVIAGRTIRIALEDADMKRLDVSFDELKSGKSDSVSELLKAAGAYCGDVFSGRRLFVEAFRKSDGGCMLYISPIDLEKPPCSDYICISDSYYDIVRLCRILSGEDIGFSALYEKNGIYRLVLSDASRLRSGLYALSEFSEVCRADKADIADTKEYFRLEKADIVRALSSE